MLRNSGVDGWLFSKNPMCFFGEKYLLFSVVLLLRQVARLTRVIDYSTTIATRNNNNNNMKRVYILRYYAHDGCIYLL